jgi:hypothetical protein
MYQGLLELRKLAMERRGVEDVVRIEEVAAVQSIKPMIQLMHNRAHAHLLRKGGEYAMLKNWVLESGFYGEEGLKAFSRAVTHVTGLLQVRRTYCSSACGRHCVRS